MTQEGRGMTGRPGLVLAPYWRPPTRRFLSPVFLLFYPVSTRPYLLHAMYGRCVSLVGG